MSDNNANCPTTYCVFDHSCLDCKKWLLALYELPDAVAVCYICCDPSPTFAVAGLPTAPPVGNSGHGQETGPSYVNA